MSPTISPILKLSKAMGAKLQINGQTLFLQYLGKGQSRSCYLDPVHRQVYSISASNTSSASQQTDFNKEVLLRCAPNRHIPQVESIGSLEPRERRRVYRMPYYRPLDPTETEAWEQYQQLAAIQRQAHHELGRKIEPRSALLINDAIVRLCGRVDGMECVCRALADIAYEAMQLGPQYVLSFATNNFKVSDDGFLLLFDCLEDLDDKGPKQGLALVAQQD